MAAAAPLGGENINQHVQKEHDEILRKGNKAKLNVKAPGAVMLMRKQDLRDQSGVEDPPPYSYYEMPGWRAHPASGRKFWFRGRERASTKALFISPSPGGGALPDQPFTKLQK